MSRYAYGRAAENWLLKEIVSDVECICCTRASRSLGPWDLCAVMREETWFLQCKAMKGNKVRGLGEARRAIEPLSSSILHRMCWIVCIGSNKVFWQGYLDGENELRKPRGWYHYPNGPFETIGERVKTREKEEC